MATGRIARRGRAALAAVTLTALLAGCGSSQISTTGGGGTSRLTEASMAESWDRGLRLLAAGERERAEAEFVLARESPEYEARAARMLRQIRTAPRDYFPERYFHVELSEGESLSSLAERYLGDPLEFYALARYNAIRTPRAVAVGQRIRIPLTEQAAEVRRAETGAADTDDPITGLETGPGPGDGGGAADAESGTGGTDAGAGSSAQASEEPDAGGQAEPASNEPTPAERRERIARHYREATQAFQRQDLDATIRHCEQVLALDPDHANCRLYRARARELKRRLADIPAPG